MKCLCARYAHTSRGEDGPGRLPACFLQRGMAEELPLATGSVDVAMCHMLLHHVVSPRTALRVHTLLVEDAGISHSGNFIGKAADFMNFLLLGQVGERGSTDRAHDRGRGGKQA